MMEAQSLAALNLQAANPPQYPENPSETPQEPLVLYISRVPGTRDVILSPFKPQVKNVTGGDVASSLYYVHLELPTLDMAGPEPLRDEAQGRSSEDSSATRTIARKPVPGTIPSLGPEIAIQGDQLQLQQTRSHHENTTLRPPGDLGMPPSLQGRDNAPPLPPRWRFEDSGLGYSDSSFETNPHDGPQLNVSPRRKPVGPRQMSGVPQGRVSMDETSQRSRVQTRGRADTTGHTRQSRSLSPTKNAEYSTPPFTLSLIRRHPGTGDQWNVGKISSYETDPMAAQAPMYLSASASEPHPPQHPPIDIQIETAGYAKFRAGTQSALPPPPHLIDFMPEPRSDGSRTFSRQVSMLYSKSFSSTVRSTFHKLEQKARKKAQAHNRNESEASIASHSSGEYMAGSPTTTRPDKMKPRGYAFASPWNGKCVFHTGKDGRSLVCEHSLHVGELGGFNPLVPDSSVAKGTPTVVSELRYNLPGSEFFPSSEVPKGDMNAKLGHFSKKIKSAVDRGYGDEDEDDVVSPFDVNVGAERAGGGNRGNRAKLSKLIIYHDGMKMLDLLVAANMGLWWRTWEKSY
ncbi:hypothetical protein HDV63DRAFT_395762 [Trichoderma sp. SZMC 28014]